jgi:hypothetical protein
MDVACFYHFLEEQKEDFFLGLSQKIRRISVAVGSLERMRVLKHIDRLSERSWIFKVIIPLLLKSEKDYAVSDFI